MSERHSTVDGGLNPFTVSPLILAVFVDSVENKANNKKDLNAKQLEKVSVHITKWADISIFIIKMLVLAN